MSLRLLYLATITGEFDSSAPGVVASEPGGWQSSDSVSATAPDLSGGCCCSCSSFFEFSSDSAVSVDLASLVGEAAAVATSPMAACRCFRNYILNIELTSNVSFSAATSVAILFQNILCEKNSTDCGCFHDMHVFVAVVCFKDCFSQKTCARA